MTIFSCTWVTVHPNVPCPKNENPVISFAGHRSPLFICALLVPSTCRRGQLGSSLANRDKGEFKTFGYIIPINLLLERRWSTTHGFFMIVGGSHLFEGSLKETGKDNRNISQEDDKRSTHCKRMILRIVMVTSHSLCRPRQKPRTRERATGSLNPLSCSKHRGS